jgi:hypothetical protein
MKKRFMFDVTDSNSGGDQSGANSASASSNSEGTGSITGATDSDSSDDSDSSQALSPNVVAPLSGGDTAGAATAAASNAAAAIDDLTTVVTGYLTTSEGSDKPETVIQAAADLLKQIDTLATPPTGSSDILTQVYTTAITHAKAIVEKASIDFLTSLEAPATQSAS